MKHLLVVLIFIGSISVPAHAGMFDAFADVISFGHVGRERDRTRAEMHRIQALEKLLEEERRKAEKIESLMQQNAIHSADLAANIKVLEGLDMLTDLIKSLEGFALQVYTLLLETNVEKELFTKLIVLQQQQLIDFLNSYKKGDPNNQGIQAVEQLILNFNQQVHEFPTEDLNKDTVDQLIFESMNNTSLVVEVLRETKTLVQQRIEKQKAEIAENNRRKATLKKNSKHKPAPRFEDLGRRLSTGTYIYF